MMNFVHDSVAQMLRTPCKDTFLKNLSSGLRISTKYSGIGSECIGLWWIGMAAQRMGAIDLQPGWLEFYSACDKHPLCRRVLSHMCEEVRPQHIFKDILDRHPPLLQQQLTAAWQRGRAQTDSKDKQEESGSMQECTL